MFLFSPFLLMAAVSESTNTKYSLHYFLISTVIKIGSGNTQAPIAGLFGICILPGTQFPFTVNTDHLFQSI